MFPFYGSAMPHVQIYPLRIAEIGNWLCVQAAARRRSGRRNLRSKEPRANGEPIESLEQELKPPTLRDFLNAQAPPALGLNAQAPPALGLSAQAPPALRARRVGRP